MGWRVTGAQNKVIGTLIEQADAALKAQRAIEARLDALETLAADRAAAPADGWHITVLATDPNGEEYEYRLHIGGHQCPTLEAAEAEALQRARQRWHCMTINAWEFRVSEIWARMSNSSRG